MHDPILIAAPTRCGTTCLAWLLHLHGVWIGEGDVTQDPSTNPQVPTENKHIKQYLRSVNGVPADFKKRLGQMVPTQSPWLVKAVDNLRKWEAWAHHFPEAKWLLPYRPIADCVASKGRQLKRDPMTKDTRNVKQHFAMQDVIVDNARNTHRISADALCKGGDRGEQEAAAIFGFLDMPFNPEVYHGWIEPDRWHG